MQAKVEKVKVCNVYWKLDWKDCDGKQSEEQKKVKL